MFIVQCRSVILTEKKKRETLMARKRAENREGSLGFPGFVKPVFTKDSKPLRRRKRSLGHLGSVKPVQREDAECTRLPEAEAKTMCWLPSITRAFFPGHWFPRTANTCVIHPQ
ncbi:hypothetical protein TNCV_4463631 [Trichonephila clavipes]|nr:hypothetical protein TNCV_4463631 [Trichonephila clavipes]